MAKKDKKEDVDRISKIMGEDAPEEPKEEEKPAELPEEKPKAEPSEEPKEEKSLDEMSNDLGKQEKPKKEKPVENVQQMQVRMTRAISLGFNIAIGFWLFTIILGLVIGVVLVAFFGFKLPF